MSKVAYLHFMSGSQLIRGVLSNERRNMSAMIGLSARGGQDGASMDGQREAFESRGPGGD
jgi:hypothetical protein